MIEEQPMEHRFDRRWIWCGLIALVGLVAALVRVPTRLGVQVPETRLPGFSPSLVDLSSNEHIWRVWWRARHEFISLHPPWLLTTGLALLLVIFVAGVLCLVWFALAPGPEPAETVE
jgi:hypothetical protein